MALHHIVSLYLYSGYYLVNRWKGGSVIALLHDYADIGINVSKMLAETRYSNLTAALFACTMLVWFWTRIIVLPYEMYEIYLYAPEFEPSYLVKPAFIYLLGCMCMLHFYWFNLFIKMFLNYKKKGVAEDIQNKSETVGTSNP